METEKSWRMRSHWNPGEWMRSPRAVRHRDHVYPERFRVTWERSDGLEVELDIRVDPKRGPVPMAATIRGPEGIAGEYRQPIPSMVRTAAARHAMADDGTGGVTLAGAAPVTMGEPTTRTDEGRLERVADLYRQAVADGRGVTELIEETEHVGRHTAYGLISAARKAGKLAPSSPGRKAKP